MHPVAVHVSVVPIEKIASRVSFGEVKGERSIPREAKKSPRLIPKMMREYGLLRPLGERRIMIPIVKDASMEMAPAVMRRISASFAYFIFYGNW